MSASPSVATSGADNFDDAAQQVASGQSDAQGLLDGPGPVARATASAVAPHPGAPAAGNADDFDAAARQVMGGQSLQVRLSVMNALGTNPDQAAQHQQIAQTLGVPVDSVAADPATAKQMAAMQQFDSQKLLTQYPHLAQFLSDQQNANIAHDDVQQLAAIESAVKGLPAAPAPSTPPDNAPVLSAWDAPPPTLRERLSNWWRGLFNLPSVAEERQQRGAAQAVAILAGRDADPSLVPPPNATPEQIQALNDRAWEQSRQAVGGMSQIPQKAAEDTLQALSWGAVAPVIPTQSHSWQASVAGGVGQLVGFMASPAPVAGKLVNSTPLGGVLAHTAGESFAKALSRDIVNQATTLSAATALSQAGNAALDTTSPQQAAQTLGHAAASGFESGAVFGAAGRVLPDNTALQTVLRAAGVNAANDLIQGTSPTDNRPLEDKVFNYALNTLFALHGAGRAEGGWLYDTTRAKVAEQDAATLQGVSELAAGSKLRERAPEAFRQFLQNITDDANTSTLYVDAKTLDNALAQSGVPAQDLQAKLPDVAAQMPDALQSDGLVRIPVADYATYIAGGRLDQALQPHLRTDPEGMTFAQSQDYLQDHSGQLMQEAQRIMAQDNGAAPAQSVADMIEQRLADTGRFSPDVNRAYASMLGNFYDTMAGRAGMSPQELAARYPLDVRADILPAAQSYDQGEGQRGAISFGDGIGTAPATVALFKDADLSTFLHESGHYFLEVLGDMAKRPDAPEGVKADMDSVLNWLGVKNLDEWKALDLEAKRPKHEQFARGFESYLFEGKAPSLELQGLFSRFRAWMLNVYKSLRGLNVDLTPEVRGVFDRMLASDEAIKQAEAARAYAPLFKSPEQGGMDPQAWAEYQGLGAQATTQATEDLQRRTLRDLAWLEGAKARALRDVERDAETKRAAVRAEVEGEVDAMPVYQALRFLKRGETTGPDGEEIKAEAGHKLDLDTVRQMYPETALGSPDWRKLGTGTGGVLGKNGLHPDLVADMFGFRNGDHLVRELLNTPTRAQMVEAVTDQRTLERYGDITSEQALSRAADAAIHNEVRSRFIATELRTLNKAVGPVSLLTKAAKDAAQRTVTATRVRDLNPAQYTAAETRAARRADEARLQGDMAAAAAAKRDQLLSNAMAKAALEAQDQAQRNLNYLRKFSKASTREAVGGEYMAQIDALLERYDLRSSVTKRALDRRQSLAEWVNQQVAQGYDVAVPDALLNEAQREHYKNMTVEEFQGLADAVRSIEHLGRLKEHLLDVQEQRAFDAVVGDAVQQLDQFPRRDLPEARNPGVGGKGLDKIEAKWLSAKGAVRSMDASLIKMEQVFDWLDHHDSNGVFNRVVFRRIAEAGGVENDLRAEVAGKLRELTQALPPEAQRDLGVRYDIPELIDSRTRKPSSMLKSEILAMALNTGNDSNFTKLCRGEGWSPRDVMSVLDRHMGKADWDFVQGVWDIMDHTMWPRIEAMEKRLSGVAPPKVEARPVVTKFGTYRGGYYPAVYDPLRSFDVFTKSEKSADQLFENNYQRATTQSGHTKERIEEYARPLYLSLDVLPRHLNQVIHDLAYREAVIDADRFLRDDRIRKGVENALGQEYYKQFRPWLQAIANDKVYDERGLAFWDKIAHGVRTRATMVGIGYRLSTMLVHGSTALANSVGELGPRWMVSGANAFLGSPERMAAARDFVFERSAEMRNRMNEVDRDIRDQLREMELHGQEGVTGAGARTLEGFRRFGFYGVAMLDMASAMPTWMGAYNKALAPTERGGLGLSEQDAIYYADKAVRNAHGGGGVKDLAAIQRGSEFQKLGTLFYSYFNHFYNRQRDIGRTAVQAYGKAQAGDYAGARRDFAMVLARSWWYFIIPQLLHAALKGSGPQDDQHWGRWAAEEIGLGMFAGIPLLRDVVNAVATGRPYEATPAESMARNVLNETGPDVKHAAQGEPVSDKWVKHAVTTAGYVFGLPTGQAANAAQFLWDVDQGRQSPQDLAGWWQGMTTGKAAH